MTTAYDIIDPEKHRGLDGGVVVDRPHMIFPGGLYASSEPYINMINHGRELLTQLPRDELVNGAYSVNGNHDGFERLGNIMGVPALPKGEPPYDAPSHMDKPAPPAKHLAVWLTLAELLIPDVVKAASVSINKYSSIGAPSRSKDPDDKIREALKWCNNAEDRLRMVAAGAMRRLRTQEGLVWVFTVGERYQPDKQGRQREVLSYGKGWVKTRIDPPLPWAGRGDHWRRCRNRVINVAPMSAFPLRALARSWKKHMDRTAPFTCVHATPEGAAAKLNRFPAVRFFDVSNHDWNIPWSMVEVVARVMERKLGPVWPTLMLMTMRQPQLLRPDDVGQKGHRLEGDPFDLTTFKARYVNPSGMPPTSEWARFAGIAYFVGALVDTGHIGGSAAELAAFLRGEHPRWAILNAGDNLAVGGPSDAEIDRVAKSVKFVEIDTADSLLGWVPFRDNGVLTFEPSITSLVYNLWMPGRSADDPQRGDPFVGAGPRRAYYSRARYFKEVDKIMVDLMREHIGVDYARDQKPAAPRLLVDRVAQILAENPDAIYYKVDKDEVPPALLAELFITIPEQEMARVVRAVELVRALPQWPALLTMLLEV